MAVFSEFSFPSKDGRHRIAGYQWLPEGGAPKAVVQLVHGVAEHLGRYDAFARYLADHGFAVCGGTTWATARRWTTANTAISAKRTAGRW